MKTLKMIAFFCVVALAMFFIAGCAAKNAEEYEEADGFDELETEADGVEDVDDEEDDTNDEDVEEVDDADEEEIDNEEDEETAPRTVTTETSAKEPTTLKKVTVTEGEMVSINVKGTDPDGDKLSYTFSKPLSAQGKWQTKRGDAGVYHADVTASDGKTSITKTIEIEVLKSFQPPLMEKLRDVTIEEGDTVTLEPKISDPDGDKVTITYTGWMTSASKVTDYDSAGNYVVTVTATDGEYEVSQDVRVTVTDINRAPDFDVLLQ